MGNERAATATDRMDPARLDRLYRENVRRVYGYARNRVGTDAALDVTAEVFLAAAAVLREDTGHVTTAWLMGVTRHKTADHWRRVYRARDRAFLTHTPERETIVLPDDWGEDPRRPGVVAALDRLVDTDRSLLMRHHVDGVPVAEIAAARGKTVAAIESALARARRRFRRHYREV